MLEKCKGGHIKEEEKNLGILKIPVNIDIFEKLVGTLKKWQCPFFFFLTVQYHFILPSTIFKSKADFENQQQQQTQRNK